MMLFQQAQGVLMKFLILLTAFSFTYSNAASFKTSDCQNTNWEERGKIDGEQGERIELLYRYTKKCDKAGTPFSADLYRKGREEGLYTFCSNGNAYKMGLMKKRVRKDTCAFNMFPEFQTYYDKGINYKKLERQKASLQRKIDRLNKIVTKLQVAKDKDEELELAMEKLEFKPEMVKTKIIKSTLVDSMSQPVDADPGVETSAKSKNPMDIDNYPGDMDNERKPSGNPN